MEGFSVVGVEILRVLVAGSYRTISLLVSLVQITNLPQG